MKRATGTIVLLCAAMMIFAAGCSSVQSGSRDGISEGISGLFRRGGDSGSSGSDGSSSGSGGSGGTSTAPERNYSGSSQTVPWPSDTEWGRYGLSGLRQPPGTDVTAAALYQGAYHVGLINGGKPAFENLVAQIENMPGAELTTDVNASDGRMVGYSLSGGNVQITADFVDGDITITASK
ncbi:MAG: hypothetical protein LBQ57_07510 [Spirochaetales bacterium]|jgi:hypothetical protein|nr:hypothetical protein [Spirochaetales bacterium]